MAVICQHANRLQSRGHVVVLLSTVDVTPMDWFPSQSVPIQHIRDWSEELDIVVATGWSTAFWLYEVSAKVLCYFVQSDETRFHPEDSRWQHITALTYFLQVNYVTEARWIRTWLKENFGHDAALVPNGLDPAIFHPCEPLAPKGSKPRVLLEGAIGLPYKGMAEAFEVVSPLDVEVWCVSSYGAPEPGWKCDRFFEHVPMRDMRKIYSSCDVLLKLSRVEGFFGPPMEMMACGGVSVVGKVTGYDEYIIDEENALVVEPYDIDAARLAVNRLINDQSLRQKLSAAGRATVDAWQWEASIDVLEAYYQELLDDPSRWSGHAQRAKHHRSIVFAYQQLSRVILPDTVAANQLTNPLPPHVLKLATYMSNRKAFILCANVVQKAHRIYKRVGRFVQKKQ